MLASYLILALLTLLNSEFANKIASKPDKMDIQFYVTTPLGTIYHTNPIFRDCTVNVERKTHPY